MKTRNLDVKAGFSESGQIMVPIISLCTLPFSTLTFEATHCTPRMTFRFNTCQSSVDVKGVQLPIRLWLAVAIHRSQRQTLE